MRDHLQAYSQMIQSDDGSLSAENYWSSGHSVFDMTNLSESPQKTSMSNPTSRVLIVAR
jgi:hypothetical protein